MSIETDFRALLVTHGPLTALVGTRISANAMPENSPYPCVVFTAAHEYDGAIDGSHTSDRCTLTVACWATSAAQASNVADAVVDALAGAPSSATVTVLARATAFDADLNVDAEQLAIEWWV